MARYLISAAMKARGHEDWSASRTVTADTMDEAIEEVGDAIEPPEALRDAKDDIWYFKMEVIKQDG